MKAFYADHFVLPLPPEHRFPMQKYARLRERVLAENVIAPECLLIPAAATDDQLRLAHTDAYLQRVLHGGLTAAEIRRIGFPWSPQMVERCRRTCGGTIGAARHALTDGAAVNLAGGTHHAGRDHGEGYCVFNDSPIAARVMQQEGRVQRVIVIDCDVHQGNGTAEIARGDDSLYTFSIHGEKNFPFRKIAGDLDLGLPDHTGDRDYLAMLEIGLERALYAARPQLALYVSGADPYHGDKLGKLALTKAGLAARDRLVFSLCHAERIPVAVSMGGGYAPQVEDIVDIHLQTVRIAAEFAARWPL
ncbi:MAG: histone deacetylase [Anaerolineae bacterium]|jgi:acetoin utilization deacetylase AcuC-like enzyme|nr:histone deacetylase [Anaerolineae bacterium]